MLEIKLITAAQTIPVRHQVLRIGKPIETCAFDGDYEVDTIHFGVFEGNNILGIASLFNKKNDLFSHENQRQLRGMAILSEHQKKGLGEKLLQAVEKYCASNNISLLWFNARETAVNFYQQNGFKIIGSIFEIKEIGNHFVMYKEL